MFAGIAEVLGAVAFGIVVLTMSVIMRGATVTDRALYAFFAVALGAGVWAAMVWIGGEIDMMRYGYRVQVYDAAGNLINSVEVLPR